VLALRARQKRNFLTTLFVSRGVPLLLGGDEMSRTQGGNNNAYCQDNEISWFDWSARRRRGDPLIEFTRHLVMACGASCRCCATTQLADRPARRGSRRDLAWYSVWGLPMTEEEWTNPSVRCIAMRCRRPASRPRDGQPSPRRAAAVQRHHEDVVFTLPEAAGVPRMAPARRHRQGHFAHDAAEAVQPQAKIELRVALPMAVLVAGTRP
jgi:isoamylase